MREELLKLTIGALLHDIGKVVQRQGGFSGTHSKIGKDFLEEIVKDSHILDCVRYHHNSEMTGKADISPLSYITYIANNIASVADTREDIIEDAGTSFNSRTPLASVFDLLISRNNEMNSKSESKIYYPPFVINTNSKELNYPSEYINFENDIYKNIVDTLSNNFKDFEISEKYVNRLLEVLEELLSFVPSSTYKEEVTDISLYDHLKLTAAAASSIYLYLEEKGEKDFHKMLFKEENKFKEEHFALLYSVDVSGIQDFIYAIHSEKALKTLRAKSFYLEIFTENLADNLLCEIGLSRANLIYSGGGHFYLLVPNTEQTKETLSEAIKNTNKWLLNIFDNSLFIEAGYSEVSFNTLKNSPKNSYKEIFRKASKMISEQKLSRYTAEDIESLNNKHTEGRECKICHTVSHAINDEETCSFCNSLIGFSNDIIGKDFFAILNDSGDIPIYCGQFIKSFNEEEIEKEPNKENSIIRLYGKNKFYSGNNLATRLWVGDYYKDKDIPNYAKNAKGIKRLGALRLDVDNLGDAFTKGFAPKYNTLSRTATLSRQLSMFFKYYINVILENKNANISIIYAGGDDVFLLGSWLDVIEASVFINKEFEKFCIGKLSISAGIGIFRDKFPVKEIARTTGALEEISKDEGKNRITIFDKNLHFTWAEFDDVQNKVLFLEEHLETSEKGMSFIYRLLDFIRGMEEETQEQINIARLAYTLAKNAENAKNEESYRIFSNEVYKWIGQKEERKKLIASLYIYVYKNREREDDDDK